MSSNELILFLESDSDFNDDGNGELPRLLGAAWCRDEMRFERRCRVCSRVLADMSENEVRPL